MNRIRINSIITGLIILLLISGCEKQKPVAKSVIYLPRIENIVIDGFTEEWAIVEGYRLWADPLGNYKEPSDFEAGIKAAWNKEGLLLQFEVTDDSFKSDTLNPWNGDAIEIFLAPFRGSEEIIQISIVPLPEKDFIRFNGLNKNESNHKFSGEIYSVTRSYENKRITEVKIGFQKNEYEGINEQAPFSSFALQVYADDADAGKQEKNKLVWYPVGQSYLSSSSMFTVNLSDNNQTKLNGTTRLVITDNEKLDLYVFGAVGGEKIEIYRNGELIKHFRSKSERAYLPDTFDITPFGWDIENDSLFVCLNGESLCLHELFLSPRLYETISEKRFDREIRNFMFMDRQSFPPENATLFIGSSSIVRWETLKMDFPELKIIQRGFGGSTSPEALMYINQIVIPYKPAKIIYYEGDNDITIGLTSEEICDNVKDFIDKVAESLPETMIYILSPKPSINRMHLWEKYRHAHESLRKLSYEYKNVVYVDVATPMFDLNGKLNHSLFVDDGIHMNQEGYAIWTRVLRRALNLLNN